MTLPKTIAIASQKGGVAKTTTCFSLGGSLAEQGKSVLLIDLDPQAHLTLSLGLNPEELRHTIRDAFLGNTSLVSVTRETGVPLLDLAQDPLPPPLRSGRLHSLLQGWMV